MDAPLAARLEFEVLDRIGDVDAPPVEAGRFEGTIEHLPRGADKGLAGQIFLVARLFAHEHYLRRLRPFAEDRLRRVIIERAPPAALHRRPRGGEGGDIADLLLAPRSLWDGR